MVMYGDRPGLIYDVIFNFDLARVILATHVIILMSGPFLLSVSLYTAVTIPHIQSNIL